MAAAKRIRKAVGITLDSDQPLTLDALAALVDLVSEVSETAGAKASDVTVGYTSNQISFYLVV